MTKPAMLMLDESQADGHNRVAPRACAMELFIDLTTTAHATGKSAGSTRVEWQVTQHVAAQEIAAAGKNKKHDTVMRFVAWSGAESAFVELLPESMATMRDDCMVSPGAPRGTRLEDEMIAPERGKRRVLLVTGAGWLSNAHYQHELRGLRKRLDAELHVVIHDVTHLMFPHWFSEAEATRIGANLIAMIASADALMVYSDSTARDIDTVAARFGVQCPPIRRIALGSDLPAAGPVAPIEELPFAQMLGGRPFVLYVSTLTFRKNHDFIYQVWRRLAAEMGDALPWLLLVGRVSPDQNVLADRIRRDPAVANHVRILTDVTDDQLASLYTHCAFTVYPSLYEGWGLPVAESLQYKKVCVTSNAASLPESSGGVTPLIDPFDHAAWCAEIRRLVSEPRALSRIESRIRKYRPTSWAGAAERVRASVAKPATRRNGTPRRKTTLRLVSNADTKEMSWRMAGVDGFTRGDRPGTLVASGDRARMGILLDEIPPPGIRVWGTVQPLIESTSRLEVFLGGHLSDILPLDPGITGAPRAITTWRAVLNTRGLVDLDFRVSPPLDGSARTGSSPFTVSDLRIERLDAEEAAAIENQQHLRWAAGDIASFGAGSRRGLKFLRDGWDRPAPWGVWSLGPESNIEFVPMFLGGRPLFLRMLVRGFVLPQAPTIDVEVLVDGEHVDTWHFDHADGDPRTERTLKLPASAAAPRPINVTFRIPECRSPRDLGLNEDERMLGVGLVRAQWLFEGPDGPDPHWGGGVRR